MVLEFTVVNATKLRQAVDALPAGKLRYVILMWSPQFFAIQCFLDQRLPAGQNPTALLKLAPESFSEYKSTDDFYHAAVDFVDLMTLLNLTDTGDTIRFSEMAEPIASSPNPLGFLCAHVSTPAQDDPEEEITFMVELKIYGHLPEKMLRSADVSHDPSSSPLPPVATFVALAFFKMMALINPSNEEPVTITAAQGRVFFNLVGKPLKDSLVMKAEGGLISQRGDIVGANMVHCVIPMKYVDVFQTTDLSSEVSLYRRPAGATLLWFKLDPPLTFLHGDLIHYFD
ncbi:unnamed protein product [Cuscuta europaea]|uniref:Uncharacterized protein n=1 Tax=Cuscuta europaea TaxID=41803 RepID=A0A9P0YNG9_CUSEU|nr:unnamed protein product [Cuscuta europaea]